MHRRRTSSSIAFYALFAPFAVLLAALGAAPPAAADDPPPNVLVLLVDDLGIEHLELYGIGSEFVPTPHLDALAADGLVFANAWTNPACSPTRVLLHTGRYAWRTGVGTAVTDDSVQGMRLEELTLPELLRDHAPVPYSTAAFGKWHMGMDASLGGLSAPNLAGYDHFEGTEGNILAPESYYDYTAIIDGVEVEVSDGYATSDLVDVAVSWIDAASPPWFAYVAFQAPHAPLHWPPEELHSQDTSQTTDLAQFRAMMEAADTEMGRLLDSIDTTDTLIVFASDNGSVGSLALPPVKQGRAKGTPFEGGVRVPMVLAGDPVAAGDVSHIVHMVDLYPTIAELAGATIPGDVEIDGVSLVPYFSDPQAGPLRDVNYVERFEPNGTEEPWDFWRHAARDERYKLLATDTGAEAFVDLVEDPWESTNLLNGSLTPGEQQAYDELRAYLDSIEAPTCDLGQPGDPCDDDADCCSGDCDGFFFRTCD